MANKKQKNVEHPCYGPCADCGAIDSRGKGDHKEPELIPQFRVVRRVSPSGKSNFVHLCQKCYRTV